MRSPAVDRYVPITSGVPRRAPTATELPSGAGICHGSILVLQPVRKRLVKIILTNLSTHQMFCHRFDCRIASPVSPAGRRALAQLADFSREFVELTACAAMAFDRRHRGSAQTSALGSRLAAYRIHSGLARRCPEPVLLSACRWQFCHCFAPSRIGTCGYPAIRELKLVAATSTRRAPMPTSPLFLLTAKVGC